MDEKTQLWLEIDQIERQLDKNKKRSSLNGTLHRQRERLYEQLGIK